MFARLGSALGAAHVGRAIGFITIGLGVVLAVAPALWPELNYLLAYIGVGLMGLGGVYLIWALLRPSKSARKSEPGQGFSIQAYGTVRPSRKVQVMCSELADAIQTEWDSDHTPPQFEDYRKRLREQIKPRVEAFHVWPRKLERLSKKKNWDRKVALEAKSELRKLVSSEPVVVTPPPAILHIDRTFTQQVRFAINRTPLMRRYRRFRKWLKHGV